MNAAAGAKGRIADVTGRVRDPAKTRTLVTPEGIALSVQIASSGARAGALTIDIVIIMLTLILGTIFLGVLGFQISGDEGGSAGIGVVILWFIFVFLLRNFYFTAFELSPRGATWGKRLMGIRVASRDGGRLTTEAVIARNLLRDVELFLPLMFMMSNAMLGDGAGWGAAAGMAWIAIFLFLPFFNKDRLRGGDMIAGTWVIETPRLKLASLVAESEAARGISVATGARYEFSAAELGHYGEYELQTLEKVLRQGEEAALVSVAEAICTKIGWNAGTGDERAFLEAYYTQLRASLEAKMRFGKRRASKFEDQI